MKIAVTGKGGVGKTTLAALLAHYLAESGREVIAVDADPDANLAAALGVGEDGMPEPISQMRELIEQRTGAKGGYGAFFKINPKVDDLPEKFSVVVEGIRLMVLGGVRDGGAGCICPESSLLKALVMHLVLGRGETVILDMEAGIEHLGRASTQGVSAMIIVIEPGSRSIQTAHTIRRLARDIGMTRIGIVINKWRDDIPMGPLEEALEGLPVLATLHWDEEILKADMESRSPWTASDGQKECMASLMTALDKMTGSG